MAHPTMIKFVLCSTDFYHLQSESTQKIGFPPGVANEVVQRMFQRYERQARYEEQAAVLKNVATTEDNIPVACEEVELTAESVGPHVQSDIPICVSALGSKKEKKTNHGEFYNGDDRGNYRWSQTIHDIDLILEVPDNIKKAKQLQVKIEPEHLKVEHVIDGTSVVLIDHFFPHKVAVDECLWSLVPSEHIQVFINSKRHMLVVRNHLSILPVPSAGKSREEGGAMVGPSLHHRPADQRQEN